MSILKRPFDLALVICFAVFAFTSLAMEPYVVFAIDLHRAHDPLAAGWLFYAASWDPIFLATPPWLRLLCGADLFLYGPFYLIAIYAFVKRRDWIRLPALLYVAVMTFGTLIYFAMELWTERSRADLPMVVIVNLPYLIVPLLLAYRVRRARPFAAVERGASDDAFADGAAGARVAGDARVS